MGWVSAIDSRGRTIRIADAHRGDGNRFVVRADEKLTAFVELEAAIVDQRNSAEIEQSSERVNANEKRPQSLRLL